MQQRSIAGAAALLCLAAAPLWAAEVPVTLRGSPESMERQNRIAREHGLTFTRTPAQIREMEARGELVRLRSGADLGFRDGLTEPVAHPVARTFLERTAAQYRAACGERLIVTSVTRPTSRQPANSHPLSVHPTGIAVDLRISQKAACRSWLEREMLALEREGVLDITREQRPPHYHVALFPNRYLAYLERVEKTEIREVPPVEAVLSLPEAAFSRLAPPVPAVAAGTQRATAALRPSSGVQRLGGAQWAALAVLPAFFLAGGALLRRRRRE
jgi:hypothetical protein